MPQRITCPSCAAPLNLPDEMIGTNVRCPKCGTTFLAQASAPPPPPPTESGVRVDAGSSSDSPRRRPAAEDEDYPDSGRGSLRDDNVDRRPHRGGLVMGLGIASVAGAVIGFMGAICCGAFGLLVTGAVALGLGIPAWMMGQRDLAAIRMGDMDSSGEGQTKAGWICGIIGTVLGGMSLLCGVAGVIFFIVMLVSGNMK